MYKKIWLYIVIIAHTAVIGWFWYDGSGKLLYNDTASILLSIGRLSGLILVSLVLLQLLIMSRAPWLEQAFGLDKLARVHHKIGKYFIIPLIAHPLLITATYASWAQIPYIQQYINMLRYDDIPGAVIGFWLFLFIIVYSILQVWKKWNFERWYYVHLATYLAVALSFGHQLELGGDFSKSDIFTYYWYAAYAFVAINLLYFRFLLPLLNFQEHTFTVADVKAETADVTSVYISGKNLEKFTFRGGQFLIVRFLTKPFWWEAHPFSISKNFDGKTLRQSIKGIGDFTKQISEIKPGTKVLAEGPYGIFTAERSKTNKVLLIAGGIGITPYVAILEDLGKAGKDIHLVYGNKTEADIALRLELEALAQKYNITIHHVLSNQSDISHLTATERSLSTFTTGFVTSELIGQLVPDAAQREVFLCGPPPMMNALIKSLPSIGIDKDTIYFEKFSL